MPLSCAERDYTKEYDGSFVRRLVGQSISLVNDVDQILGGKYDG